MLLLVGIPLLVVAMFAFVFIASLIVGFVLLRSRHRRVAPFFFFVPTFASACAVIFAWPTAFLLLRLNPDAFERNQEAGYFIMFLGFPIGALFGLCIGFIPALLVRRRMRIQT